MITYVQYDNSFTQNICGSIYYINGTSAVNGLTIDYIRPMDMKLISATGHRLISHPELYQPERPNIYMTFIMHKSY